MLNLQQMFFLGSAFSNFTDTNPHLDKQSLTVKGWLKYSCYPSTYCCWQGFRGKEIKPQDVHPEYSYPVRYNCTPWLSWMKILSIWYFIALLSTEKRCELSWLGLLSNGTLCNSGGPRPYCVSWNVQVLSLSLQIKNYLSCSSSGLFIIHPQKQKSFNRGGGGSWASGEPIMQ